MKSAGDFAFGVCMRREHVLKVIMAKENHETGKQLKEIIFQIQQLLLHFVDLLQIYSRRLEISCWAFSFDQ